MSKAYELMKRFEALSEVDRRYVFQFFTGCLAQVHEGFTKPHEDQPHAAWAVTELEKAIKQRDGINPRIKRDDLLGEGVAHVLVREEADMTINPPARSAIEKPPLGLTPRYIHNERRETEIFEAVNRYNVARKPIQIEWIEEINEIRTRSILVKQQTEQQK